MMGSKVRRCAPLPNVSLEELVPQDHFYRHLDRKLDLSFENIKAIEDQGIRAYVPLPNWEERYEVWSASHFRYEPQVDQYRCPQGQMLHRVGVVNPDGRQLYRAAASICNACPVKGQCTTSHQGRRVYRHVGEEYLERVRTYQQTFAYQKAMRKRKVWVEPLFAEAKDWHGLRRFRLRL